MSTEEWSDGYKAGNAGLLQAIETAEQIATMREQKRIIKLLEEQAEITGYVEIQLGKLIALIKGENK